MKQTYTITIEREVSAPSEAAAQVIANSLANDINGNVAKVDNNNDLPF
ncbi:hypothetical protein [Aquimarina algiphila]|nr:hypothetical protein [Aquimarina algiphila]